MPARRMRGQRTQARPMAAGSSSAVQARGRSATCSTAGKTASRRCRSSESRLTRTRTCGSRRTQRCICSVRATRRSRVSMARAACTCLDPRSRSAMTPPDSSTPALQVRPRRPESAKSLVAAQGRATSAKVFVGYWAYHDWTITDGTEQDPWRHSGKLDRVRLKTDKSGNPSLEVVRFDMVSNNTVQYWHNKSVVRMVYDHFIHPHELYVGCDHGVDKISPDKWHPPVGPWFLSPENQQSWMSDHLHPQACLHQTCPNGAGTGSVPQMLADWRGLAIAPDGDLWVGGRY